MFYVIDRKKGYVTHESRNRAECEAYIGNATSLFGGDFILAIGAKDRDQLLKKLKSPGRRAWEAYTED